MDKPLIPEAVLRALMHYVSHCSWCDGEVSTHLAWCPMARLRSRGSDGEIREKPGGNDQ